MADHLALITLILWPVIPLFWIPVHGGITVFRRLGPLTYIMPVMTWVPLALFMYSQRHFLLSFKIEIPLFLKAGGFLLLAAGTVLHLWTARLLGLRGIIGIPEVSPRREMKLVREGPFAVVRHPTYVAHTLMLSGVFLLTGVVTIGLITLLDFIVVNTVVIPLEERELRERFGEDFDRYRQDVPAFFPRIGG